MVITEIDMIDIAELYCEDCDKWYNINYKYVSELFGRQCPKCNSDNTWFGEILCDKSDELVLGKGGCGSSIGK